MLSDSVVKDASEDSDALIVDLDVRGVWQSQSMVLFDFYVVDSDVMFYLSHSPTAVLASAEAEKKWKYCATSSDCRATFTPLCFSVDGLAGDEANSFMQHLAPSLSFKWDRRFSEILGWLHACLAFALVWAINVCI